MQRIIDIIKLKIKKKDDLGQWYKDRLDVCNTCPFNSKNKEKKNKLLALLSLNKDFCTVCGCTLVDKASGEFELCPKDKWRNIEEYED